MSKTYRHQRGGERPRRRISVKGVRRTPTDIRKLSQALIALAAAEQAAQTEHDKRPDKADGDHHGA